MPRTSIPSAPPRSLCACSSCRMAAFAFWCRACRARASTMSKRRPVICRLASNRCRSRNRARILKPKPCCATCVHRLKRPSASAKTFRPKSCRSWRTWMNRRDSRTWRHQILNSRSKMRSQSLNSWMSMPGCAASMNCSTRKSKSSRCRPKSTRRPKVKLTVHSASFICGSS